MRILTFFATIGLILSLQSPVFAAGEDAELQSMVDELRGITEKARQQRAADRWLLTAMEDLVAKYDWPWRDELISEDFSDGDFSQDPAWQTVSGEFWLDRRLGLRSRTPIRETRQEQPAEEPKKEKQDIGKALLGALLKEALGPEKEKEQQQSSQQPSGPAEIQLPQQIPSVFAAEMEISVHNRPAEEGQYEFGLYQDSQGGSGYRLVLFTGDRPALEVLSIRSGRTMVLDNVTIDDLGDGESHTLGWRRDPTGRMEVFVDGTSVSSVRDNSFRYPFKQFNLTNKGGDMALQSLSLQGGS